MKRGLALLMLLAFTFILIAPMVEAGNYTPLLRVKVSDIYLTAGEENTIEIELRNTGSYSVYEVEAILTSTNPGIAVIDKGHMIFNEIEAEKSKRYRPVIYVDEDTPIGPYTLTLTLTYRQMYKLGTPYIHTTSLQIGVVVVNASKPKIGLRIGLTDPHLTAGEENEVSLEVRNRGSETLRDIEVTLTSNTPYIAVLDGLLDIDELKPGESEYRAITLAVPSGAPKGVYTLTATATYRDEDGESHSDVETIGVSIEEVKVERETTILLESYEASSLEAKPGESLTLTLNLKCVGAEAYEVKVTLTPDPMGIFSLLTPSLQYIGDLKPGERTSVSYKLRVDGEAKAGQYPLTLQITYIDSDGLPGSAAEAVTLMVTPLVEFRILIDGSIHAYKGASATLSGDLLLIGTESVRFVELGVEGDNVFKAVDSEYVGEVDPDSPIPFDLTFTVSGNATEGVHSLRVRVSYLDNLNRRRSVVVEVPIQIEAQQEVEVVRKRGGIWLLIRWLLGILPR